MDMYKMIQEFQCGLEGEVFQKRLTLASLTTWYDQVISKHWLIDTLRAESSFTFSLREKGKKTLQKHFCFLFEHAWQLLRNKWPSMLTC